MPLKLYNTLTRKKEIFKSLKKKYVEMYVCGPTIYNYVHIGNLRAYIFADILRRHLKFYGYKIKEVMNLTDVDDKTIRESQREKKKLKNFTKKYEKAFLENIKAMNIEKPEIMPRATEHIKEMVALIKKLLKKGIAYKTKDGIYFSIKKFKDYGKLSNIKIKKLKSKACGRINKDEYSKEHINDFVLWKFYNKEDGDVFWETEIGKGRPGWHIECSAMSMKYLGESFDIHTGGVDLIFPHHENEIAQSEAATGKVFANFWLHNEWVLVNGKKMSKSLGNFYNLKDVIKRGYSPTDLRYLYLTKSYRQQLNFTWKNLQNAKRSLERLKNIISEIKDDKKTNKKYLDEFEKAMNDDLNTPKALQVLWRLVRDKNAPGKLKIIKKMDEVFGLNLLKKEGLIKDKIIIEDEVKVIVYEGFKPYKELTELINKRELARAKKDWKKADELRKKIKSLGYSIDDTKKGAIVRKNDRS